MAEQAYPNFTEPFFISRSDGDFAGRLKPGALLRFAQQLAVDQGARIGLDRGFYARTHTAFLLAKQVLAFARVPVVDETLQLTTVPECSKRGSNKRLTLVADAQGREIACVDSRWVLVDTDTRRIIRRPTEEFERFWNPEVARSMDLSVPKAEQLSELPARRADYLLCDLNGHINNCCYADLACASVPLDEVRARPICRLAITYHREVPLGEMLSLSCGPAGGGWYTLGCREDGMPAFEAFCATT